MKACRSLFLDGLAWLVMAAVICTLPACKPADATAGQSAAVAKGEAKSKGPATVSVMVDSVNYMHLRAPQYTLYDLSQGKPVAVGGDSLDMLASGGAKGCCLALPEVWRPGIKVRVAWTESDRERIYPEQRTKDLEVPRYAQAADLYVVFYGGDDVEVVVSVGEPGHPSWAGRIKKTPWDNCLAHNERKVCKRALPKLFDVESSRGYCTFTRSSDYPGDPKDAELTCTAAMYECMKDFEDKQYCESILWGERKK